MAGLLRILFMIRLVYVRTAFEDLPQNSFIEEPVAQKTVMRLAGADAWAAFTATIARKTTETMMVHLSLEKEIIEECCSPAGEPWFQ